MNKISSKILFIILLALLFVFIGFYLSIKSKNRQPPTTNYQPITISLSPSPTRQKAKVSFVFDGDTIELTDKRRVRYIGINAPELNIKEKKPQCFATDSAKINKELVLGQEIEMEKDASETDKYGRLLRYAYIDGIFINDFLLRQGFAKLDLIPPDLTYSEQFKAAEKEAKENKRGLWGKCQK